MEPVLTQYTVYVNPADAPGRFVVRQWHIVRGEEAPQPGQAWSTNSLEEARSVVPLDLVCIERSPDDDPSILETWT